mmetsp:Transcript_48602/g.126112  ORF Transcript_48602/g.126112 Transcript_48602/m.126112 type:complete len:459 (+) Transcript_48602:720-2096(+)
MMPLRIFTFPVGTWLPLALVGFFKVAWYSTCGLPRRSCMILKSSASRSRTSSRCRGPVQDSTCSPHWETRRARPSSSRCSASSASRSRLCSFLSRPSSCSAKLHPAASAAAPASPSGRIAGEVPTGRWASHSVRPWAPSALWSSQPGAGSTTRSPGPAVGHSTSSPRAPWIRTFGMVKASLCELPANFTSSPLLSVPSRMRTSTCRSPPCAGARTAKAQPTKGGTVSKNTPPNRLTPRLSTSAFPSPGGMNSWTTSCSASMPMPVLALPATSGITLPAATARCRAPSMTTRGTSPSNSTNASIISSSTAASDSICWSRSSLHQAARSSAGLSLPPPKARWQSCSEQMEPSRTLSRREPQGSPPRCAGAKSTTGRSPSRFSSASTAASKLAASSAWSTPFRKMTAGFLARSTAAKHLPQSASTPVRTEHTTMAPCAGRRALATSGERSTWPGVSMRFKR